MGASARITGVEGRAELLRVQLRVAWNTDGVVAGYYEFGSCRVEGMGCENATDLVLCPVPFCTLGSNCLCGCEWPEKRPHAGWRLRAAVPITPGFGFVIIEVAFLRDLIIQTFLTILLAAYTGTLRTSRHGQTPPTPRF